MSPGFEFFRTLFCLVSLVPLVLLCENWLRRGILRSGRRIPMDAPARSAALPARKAFLGAFQVRFRRPAGGPAVARVMTARRTARPTTNGETRAQAVPGPRAPRWQAFRTTRPWEAADRHRQRGDKLLAAGTLGDGVVGRDDPGFSPQGRAS